MKTANSLAVALSIAVLSLAAGVGCHAHIHAPHVAHALERHHYRQRPCCRAHKKAYVRAYRHSHTHHCNH